MTANVTAALPNCSWALISASLIRSAEKPERLMISKETVEKAISVRLMENVQMQGFRNPEE